MCLLNLKNLSKTELVEKFKVLSSSKTLENLKNEDKKDDDKISIKEILKSYYFKLSTFYLKFKSLLTKIALFTILIRYFRKIRIIAKIRLEIHYNIQL